MSLDIRLDGDAILLGVPPSSLSCGTIANMGEPGYGALTVEDPAAALVTTGHRPVLVQETDCSQPVLFRGWMGPRGHRRDRENAQIVDGARIHDVTLVGLGAAFGFRMITGTDGNRPEETWSARMAWLLGSNYLDGTSGALVEDTGYVMTSTLPMDAADYRGAYPSGVLDDLSDRFGGTVNYFAFWDAVAGKVGLFIGPEEDTIGDSPVRISNVLSDIDSSVTFAPDSPATLTRNPDQVFSEVVVEYSNGRKVFRSRPATAAEFIRKGTTISRPYIGKESTALDAADRFLDRHDSEEDRITVTITVPSVSAGLTYAGQRIQCRFSHLPGYEAWTWLRVFSCIVKPTDDSIARYEVLLELVNATPAPTTATQLVLYFSDTGCTTQDYPRVVMFKSDGDDPPPGWDPYVTQGFVEKIACVDYSSAPGWYGIRVLGSGTVDLEHYGGWATVTGFGDWILVSLRHHDVSAGTTIVLDTYYWEDLVPGFLHGNSDTGVNLTATGVEVEDGDYFDVYVEIIPGFSATWYYRTVGVPGNPGLYLTNGNLVAGGSTDDPQEGVPGPIQPATTVQAGAPTVNDDVSLGYQVGDRWIDSTTGNEYILTDNTDGAAVWVLSAPSAPVTADYLVGSAQAGLSAEIVVGTTPGGELGGTWPSPTVDTIHSGSAHVLLDDVLPSILESGQDPVIGTAATSARRDHEHGMPAVVFEQLVADGTSGPAGLNPSAIVEMDTERSTTSASLEDITGASLTITTQRSCRVYVSMAFSCYTVSGAAPSTIAFAINVDGTDHQEMQRYLSGSTDRGIGAVVHLSDELPPGTYTVKGRFRRVSGVATPGTDELTLTAIAMGHSGPVTLTTEAEDDWLYADAD